MEAVFDPTTRKWTVPDGQDDPTAGRMGLTFADQQAMKTGTGSGAAAAMVNSDMAAAAQSAAKASQEPLLPQGGLGGWIGDTFKAGSNVAVGMGTGLVDLGLLGVDAARASTGDFGGLTQAATGMGNSTPVKKMTWNDVGESKDNPLTAWRIQTLTPESTVFKAVSYMGEIASWFVNPKGLGGVAAEGLKAATAIGRAEDLAGVLKGAAKGEEGIGGLIGAAGKIKEALATERAARFTNAVTAVEKTPLANSSAAKRIIGAIGGAEPVMAAQMERALINSASSNPLVRSGAFIKGNFGEWANSSAAEKLNTLGQVVLKDLYANFMVMGARPVNEDASGMSRWLADNTPPPFSAAARYLVPEEQDAPMVAKTKMLLEGAIIGFATQPLIDAARVGLMARRNKFSELSPEFRNQILGILQDPSRAPDYVALKAGQMMEEARVGSPAAERLSLPAAGQTTDSAAMLQGTLERRRAARAVTLDDLRAHVDAANATSDAAKALNRTAAEEQTFQQARTILGQPGSAPGPTTALVPEASAGTANVGAPGPATVLAPLPTPKAVVSPEAIRNAAKGELEEFLVKNANDGGVNPEAVAAKVEEVGSKVMGLLPPDRAGRVDYMKTFIPKVNRAGVMDAIDSIWHDGVTKQGLEEGWVRMADDFSGYQFSRAEAQALDESDALSKLADEVHAASEQERLLKPAAADVPAAEQTVDVQAAPVEQAPAGQAPVNPTDQSVVAQGQAKVQAASNQLQDTVAAGAERQPQPDMPTQGMGQELAQPSIAADGLAPQAVDPKQAPPALDAVGQMKAQLQEIIDNPGAAGTASRTFNERRAKMLVSQLESQGQWDGRGLKGVDEGALAPAVDAGAAARALQDEVFSPISAPVPPKLTDSFEISLPKISQNEKAMLAEAFGTGEAKVAFGAYSAKGGAKSMGEVAEMLEGMTKADGWTQGEIRTGASLSKKIRAALEGNAAAINEQAMTEGMVKEAVNDIKGLPNCDLTELL
jgi:hypothetical protein